MILILILILTPASLWAWQGQVVGVPDGGTITVSHDGKNEKVRLYGIYCPEHRQDFSQEAKEFTSKMVSGEFVEVKPMDTDRYGRTVGMVSIDEKSLNEELVRAGLAGVYTD
jgi:endonuclease YncB( thermonuclease family)